MWEIITETGEKKTVEANDIFDLVKRYPDTAYAKRI